MKVDLFDYRLPPGRIAERPVEPRDAARLLKIGHAFTDHIVRDLPNLLRPGDILVFNDTKVIPTQLSARLTGREISLTLHKQTGPDEWLAFAKPARLLAPGAVLSFMGSLEALVIEKKSSGQGGVRLRFSESGSVLLTRIAEIGAMPLPPYIQRRRRPDARDRRDYQTIFARREGAVAAPTAGLHFTEALFDALDRRGIHRATVTLHVGAGTFLPVRVKDTRDHVMHAEWGEVAREAAAAVNAARETGGRVVAVGTTSLRLLETAAREDGRLEPFAGETRLFITPGYRFKSVDLLFTNFHLPRSTLLMLVAAFSGRERILAAYRHAIDAGYRFYSYGDASLLYREDRLKAGKDD